MYNNANPLDERNERMLNAMRRIGNLAKDPHPGLLTWQIALNISFIDLSRELEVVVTTIDGKTL
jgi:hypothetical protein